MEETAVHPEQENEAPAPEETNADQPADETQEQADEPVTSAYDFRRPHHLSSDQMRSVQRICARASEEMQHCLARGLRMQATVQTRQIESLSLGLLLEGLPDGGFVNILDLHPLDERGVLLLETEFCQYLVDRALGGTGRAAGKTRPLTPVDQEALQGPVEMILKSLRSGCEEYCTLKLQVESRSTDCESIKICAKGEPVLCITFELTADFGVTLVRFCLPISGFRSAASGVHGPGKRGAPERNAAFQTALKKSLDQVPMTVDAVLGQSDVDVGSLLQLDVGDIIRLNDTAETPVIVRVGGKLLFRGKMGLRGRRKAVQIIERVTPNEED